LRERERFYIEAQYYAFVTGELDKSTQTYLEWTHTYPADYGPYGNLGFNYSTFGQYDKAVSETQKSLQLVPDNVVGYGNLSEAYMALGRLDEARFSSGSSASPKARGLLA
jgi:tetratricopeptide (TPR) repeat protein